MDDPATKRAKLFASAGLGGVLGWCVVHPANTVAVQMTLQSDPAKSMSFYRFSRELVSKRGILSLYDGLSAGCARQVFYATSRIGLFEVFRDLFAGTTSAAEDNGIPQAPIVTAQTRIVAGLASGALAAVISCPAEVALVRMSNDCALPHDQRRGYRNVLDAARRMHGEEGIATFWRGSVPFVQRAMVVGVCQVALNDQLKSLFSEKFKIAKGTTANIFCAAMTSGFVYSAITMPLETAKNRMAFEKLDPVTGILKYRGTLQTVASIAKGGGMKKLWSGFFPYYLRCGGHTVSMFMAVDFLRNNVGFLKPS